MQHGVNGQVAVRHVIRAEKRQDQEHAINIAKMLRTAILYKQQAAMGMIVQVRNLELKCNQNDRNHQYPKWPLLKVFHFHPKRPS